MYFKFFKPKDWQKRSDVRRRGFIQRFPKERVLKMPCCNCEKHKYRSEEERRALQNRLSRIEGQIRGLRGMIERDAYCTDILTQSAAAAAALNAFNRELLAVHIRTCVADDIRAGKDEVIDELTDTLQKLMK